VLRENPPSVLVFPVEHNLAIEAVEQERMDGEHIVVVAGHYDRAARDEASAADPGLLLDFLASPRERRLAALDVSRDPRPCAGERCHALASPNHQDSPPVPENRRDDASFDEGGDIHNASVSVDGYSIAGSQDRDRNPIDERNPAQYRARGHDRLGAFVHDGDGTMTPLRQAVEHVGAHRAPLSVGEHEDAARHGFSLEIRRGINHQAAFAVHPANERHRPRVDQTNAFATTRRDSAPGESHDAYLRRS